MSMPALALEETVPEGCRKLISRLDPAVEAGKGDHTAITSAVQKVLEECIANGDIDLPAALRRPVAERYARHSIHWDPVRNYSVLAMVWASGQGTPLHDHDGMWCVEGLLQGELAITQYELHERQDDRYRFSKDSTVSARVGSAGGLIPPFDYHTIENPNDTTAITIHVYGGQLMRCNIFEPVANNWWQAETRTLSCAS
ncbi:MAG: cysteine dioxygenase family protein [Acidobacteriota bacterium]